MKLSFGVPSPLSGGGAVLFWVWLLLLLSSPQRTSARFFEIDPFGFQVNGVLVDSSTAIPSQMCKYQWEVTASCVIQSCPNFLQVCTLSPDVDLLQPSTYMGLAAPPPAAGDETAEDGLPADNATSILRDNHDLSRMLVQGDVSCDAIVQGICGYFGADDCCLATDCSASILDLAVCMLQFQQEEEHANFVCPADEIMVECSAIPDDTAESATPPALVAGSTLIDFQAGSVDPWDFYFGDHGLNTNDMMAFCPNQWADFVDCWFDKCEFFYQVCPAMAANTNQNNDSSSPVTNAVEEPAGCNDLHNSICRLTQGEGCCLDECQVEMQTATACLHAALSGLDLRQCGNAVCTNANANVGSGGGTSSGGGAGGATVTIISSAQDAESMPEEAPDQMADQMP